MNLLKATSYSSPFYRKTFIMPLFLHTHNCKCSMLEDWDKHVLTWVLLFKKNMAFRIMASIQKMLCHKQDTANLATLIRQVYLARCMCVCISRCGVSQEWWETRDQPQKQVKTKKTTEGQKSGNRNHSFYISTCLEGHHWDLKIDNCSLLRG